MGSNAVIYKGFKYPKPTARKKEAVKVYYRPDGSVEREVCDRSTAEGRREYDRRKEEMWVRQGQRCAGPCNRILRLQEVTFGHDRCRGMGAAFQDDRIVLPDGSHQNHAECAECNGRKGSKPTYV